MLFLLSAVSPSWLVSTAQAADPNFGPTFGLAGGFYFTGPYNPISGRYLLHDPDRFPVVYALNVRPGLRIDEHWGLELNVGWLQGNTLQYNYLLTMWYPRLEGQYHLTPNRRYDLFAVAGAGITHTHVNRASAEEQSNDAGFGLYRNPSIDGIVEVGGGLKFQLAGPIWIRTDVRDIVTLGSDPTPDRSDIFNNFEWTFGFDYQAAPKKVQEPEPEPACVDTDGDGLCEDDKCPNDAEDKDDFEDADGCPDPDNDQDGILDVDDKCPNDPEDMDGFRDSDGCPEPDNDKDEFPDPKDKCPDDPENRNGYQDLDGCPDELPEEAKRFTGVIEGIYFEFDKDIIKPESEKTLQEALVVLRDFPDLRLEVQGHTDAKGDDIYNMDLSQRRAEAVVRWFVEHGLAADRFRAAGFGELVPIATNDTDTGRAKNRRVEFHPFSE